MKVWKYRLIPGVNEIMMPVGSQPLHVAVQHGAVQMWVQVNDSAQPVTRGFELVGTGQAMKTNSRKHVATFMTDSDDYVFHVFDLGER